MKLPLLLVALASAFGAAASAQAGDGAGLWAQNCAACHGKDGAGHTKAGRMAGVKDLTSASYQQGFSDAQAASQIKNGLKDKNDRVRMKAFGEVLSDAQIQDLVAFVRSLKR